MAAGECLEVALGSSPAHLEHQCHDGGFISGLINHSGSSLHQLSAWKIAVSSPPTRAMGVGRSASHENTNGLLRQYFPRATNLSHVSQAQLNAIALRLNQRPRKILDFETPADRLQKVL